MRTQVSEKLLAVMEEIGTYGSANLTRLTVLKKWFEHPGRLPAFGLWVAKRAAETKGKFTPEADVLMAEARNLFGTATTRMGGPQRINLSAAKNLHDRARAHQNEFDNQQWGPVRIIHCWPLLLVEKGLELYLNSTASPTQGYKLAADFCQHYDPHYGNSLNGPSRPKIAEIVKFIRTHETTEEQARR